MELIIAEKPAMAGEIAKILGANTRSNGFWTGNGYIVSNAIGHLIELAQPADYHPEWKTWKVENLPMLPQQFKYNVVGRTAAQYKLLKELIHQRDVASIVNACDAGREGENIFWRIYAQTGSNKPVKRLWISSLTAESIEAGFKKLRPSSEFDGLRQAAEVRQEADWIVGLNATQAQTLMARSSGGTDTYSLGRVQTPTLALVVKRDLEIEKFKSVDYFELEVSFKIQRSSETFETKLFDKEKKQYKKFLNKNEAEGILNKLKTAPVVPVRIESLVKKQKSTPPPQLFDLTSLQRAANSKFGLSATKTLELMQTLYEGKFLTYPRTSSRHLTDDLADTLKDVLNSLPSEYTGIVKSIPDANKPLSKRFVDNSKVTDHHAIIPTNRPPNLSKLSADESSIYNLVTRRFLGIFLPDAVDEIIDITVEYANEFLFARGTSEVSKGWRIVGQDSGESEEVNEEDSRSLPNILETDNLSRNNAQLLTKKTKPPARFTEGTLLGAMETAGKTIVDEESRNAMKDTGLGTAATRANIIEKLIRSNYLVREKKTLKSSPQAREIIKRLESCKSLLASPELTGQWEKALAKIERNEMPVEKFRNAAVVMVKETIAQIFAQNSTTQQSFAEVEQQTPCPNCLLQNRKGFLRHSKKDGRAFSFCTIGKEICNYITTTPTTKKHLVTLLKSNCHKCKSAMQFRLSKANSPFLTCIKRDGCDGVVWLEEKKPSKAK